jgi:hypothetical protein
MDKKPSNASLLKKSLNDERLNQEGPEPKPQYMDSEGRVFWDCKPLKLVDLDTDFIDED